MAVESLPASGGWKSEPALRSSVMLSEAASIASAARKPGSMILEESQPSSRDSDTPCSSASIFAGDGACASDLSPLLRLPSFHHQWSSFVAASLDSWQSWELPLLTSHPFWSPSSVAETLPENSRLQRMAIQAGGLAPSLLSLFATMPSDGAACQAVSSQLHSFLLWDSWMKRYGTRAEALELSNFCRSLSGAASEEASSSPSSFPPRLAAKYPLKQESFLTALDQVFPANSDSGLGWKQEYLGLWTLCAGEGLELHYKMASMRAAKQTANPAEFLLYRALTTGFPQVALLAAHNVLPVVPDTSALDAICPLLALGSMIVATYSDLLLASRMRMDASASITSQEMFDDEWTALMHNALLSVFNDEAASLLEQAESCWKSSCHVSWQLRDLVGIVQAVLHGMILWYTSAPAFQPGPSAVISAGEEPAPAFCFVQIEDEDDADEPGIPQLGSANFPQSALPAASDIPLWVAEAVDSAVDLFVQALGRRGHE